jgi:hemerythrin-like domain-containing protein
MTSTTGGSAHAHVDTQGMLLIHRVIRREFGLLPKLIRGAATKVTRAKLIARHANEMLEFLHTHHSGEDQLVWPLLRSRCALDEALINRMEEQHEAVARAVTSVAAELGRWASRADPSAGESIATRLESMNAVLDMHLAEEESEILPLIASHLSQAEWDALADHGFAAIPGKRRLVMLGHILEEANPSERAHMMLKVPPPARLAYRVIGRRQFARETTEIRGSQSPPVSTSRPGRSRPG